MKAIIVLVTTHGKESKGRFVDFDQRMGLYLVFFGDGTAAYCSVDELTFILD